jgi:phosphoglycolate phosphatase
MSTLFFDLDGTIVDSARGILASIKFTLEAMGIAPPPDESLRWVIGPPLRPTIAQLLGGSERVETGVRIYREHYRSEGLTASEPYLGIREELQRLHNAGQRLIVCTSKMQSFAHAIVERVGFGDLFEAVYGAEMGGAGDDKRELLARILSQRNDNPKRSVMIGDRREDIMAGQSNGLATVGVLWGYGDMAELSAAGATAICHRVTDLGQILGRDGVDRWRHV